MSRQEQPSAQHDHELLRPELRELLREHQLSAEVVLRSADGQPVAPELLERLHEELEAADRALLVTRRLAVLGELCAGVTHDARNLLTGILGFAQLALERAGDASPISDALRPCEEAARSCVELLTTCVSLARIQAPAPQPIGVADVILPATRLVARQFEARHCRLELALDEPPPVVLGRRGELQQIVLNLALNALHAAGPGGCVRISAQTAPGQRTRIVVADDGPGVPPELHEQIFRPLFTTKPDGEGTGLGLSLSREIAEAHGGTLTLDPAADSGARFVLELPACATEER
ncbi:MAG TPA: HAMP domain-containing sensor histidine kinase [Polyangiales bacterium]|nr:HAMP domain-containing sensor histidine kinase [Polyangiales bacterium]